MLKRAVVIKLDCIPSSNMLDSFLSFSPIISRKIPNTIRIKEFTISPTECILQTELSSPETTNQKKKNKKFLIYYFKLTNKKKNYNFFLLLFIMYTFLIRSVPTLCANLQSC